MYKGITFINLVSVLSHLLKYSSPLGIEEYLKKFIEEHKEILESKPHIALLNGYMDILLHRCIINKIPDWFIPYREIKADRLYYHSGIENRIAILGDNGYRENYLRRALPEFLQYNIVLCSIEGAV